MDEQSLWMQMWSHERSLLTQRVLIFLASSTILFLGFATLISRGGSWFCIVVSFAGVLSCLLGWLHLKELPGRLRKLEQKVPYSLKASWEEVYEQSKGRIKGRKMAVIVFPLFFGLLWIASLVYSVLIF